MPTSLAGLLCVCGIAAGQLLFKCTADSQALSGSYLHPRTLLWLLSALLLYGVTTFGWIWTLQQGALSRLYPWMALAFVIVPLLSSILLEEKLQTTYWLGVVMIVGGVCIAIRS
jgi:uncharacterized membrane protein